MEGCGRDVLARRTVPVAREMLAALVQQVEDMERELNLISVSHTLEHAKGRARNALAALDKEMS